MPKVIPSTPFSTWTVDESTGAVTFNISDLTGVTAAELHPTTGDFGIFVRAFNEKLAKFYADLPGVDRPSRWSVVKGTPQTILIQGATNPQRIPYTVNVDVAAPTNVYELIPE